MGTGEAGTYLPKTLGQGLMGNWLAGRLGTEDWRGLENLSGERGVSTRKPGRQGGRRMTETRWGNPVNREGRKRRQTGGLGTELTEDGGGGRGGSQPQRDTPVRPDSQGKET